MWACELSSYLTKRMIYLAHQWVAESPFDAKRKKVLRMIADAGPVGLTRTELTRRTQAFTPRERLEIIQALEIGGDIEEKKESSAGAPRLRYVAKQY